MTNFPVHIRERTPVKQPSGFGYTHVIWDWNGTILDDTWLCAEIMDGLLSEYMLPGLSLEKYRACFGFPVRNYYESLGFDFERIPFEKVGAEFIQRYERRRLEARPRPEAQGILETIRSRGCKQSILSAYSQNTLEELVEHFGLRDYFVRLVGLQDIYAHGKIEQGLAWMKELCLPGREVLLVGDTDHDAEVARAMGCACVLLGDGHQKASRLEQTGFPVLADAATLLRWVQSS